jgi:hypothetical protein
MKKRTKDEERAYKKLWRSRKPVPPCPTTAVLTVVDVPPVPPDDKDVVIKILRAKVLMLEKELGLLKKDKRESIQLDGQGLKPTSPYRFGPGL